MPGLNQPIYRYSCEKDGEFVSSQNGRKNCPFCLQPVEKVETLNESEWMARTPTLPTEWRAAI